MLPSTIIDYRIDFRYFIISSGSKSDDLLGKKDSPVIFVDDLIPPKRKNYTVEKYLKKISLHYSSQSASTSLDTSQSSSSSGRGRMRPRAHKLKQFYDEYRSRRLSAFHLLQEFEDTLGVREGVKAFWGLAICHTSSHAKELHEILRRSILKMRFQNPTCVLNYQPEKGNDPRRPNKKKFSFIFKTLIKKSFAFLKSKNKDMPVLDERHLNQIISNFYEIEISDMLQSWKLKRYIGPVSREHIEKVFMCPEEEIEANFVRN